MPISASIVLDSISPQGKRITTLAIELPKPYLAEFQTHRQFSRSFMSSRAVPVANLIKRVEEEPYVPIYWGANQKGMQAGEECNNTVKVLHYEPFTSYVHGEEVDGYDPQLWDQPREQAWYDGKNFMVNLAREFDEAGYHKQVVNRLLEPFSYTVGIVTATEWDNFFQLRDHPAAQPELQALAKAMRKAMDESIPKVLQPGEWHLPFLTSWQPIHTYLSSQTEEDFGGSVWNKEKVEELGKKVSVARCARVSYQSNSRPKTFTIEEDLALYDRLIGEGHWSPAEHQACPMEFPTQKSMKVLGIPNPLWEEGTTHLDWKEDFWSANYSGWVQYRQLIQSPHAQ